jgi:hypothetical protein
VCVCVCVCERERERVCRSLLDSLVPHLSHSCRYACSNLSLPLCVCVRAPTTASCVYVPLVSLCLSHDTEVLAFFLLINLFLVRSLTFSGVPSAQLPLVCVCARAPTTAYAPCGCVPLALLLWSNGTACVARVALSYVAVAAPSESPVGEVVCVLSFRCVVAPCLVAAIALCCCIH